MAVTPIEKPIVTVQYYGDSGGSTQYWYWVQAVYAMGFGPLSSNVATVTVLSLSHSNVVSINWTPCNSAMYYNVWRTTTSAAPTAGTGQCIAQGYATCDGLVDNGLPTFTIAVGTPPSLLQVPTPEQEKAEAEKADKEAKAANDKLLKQLEEDSKKAAKIKEESSEQARILNQAYNERYAPTVRETEAQKNAREAAEKDAKKEEHHDKSKNEPALTKK